MSDLFVPKNGNGNGNGHRQPSRTTPPPKSNGRSYPTADAAVASILRMLTGPGAKLTKTWPYTDAAGETVMHVARFDDDTGAKTFRPIHRLRDGWHLGDPPGPLPLYNLPLLSQSDDAVFIVEGEKCCDAAASIDVTATTSAHGAKSPHRSDWTPLAGKSVVILPDNDDAGRKYADAVAGLLRTLRPPAKVKVVELPGLDDGGDLYDYLEAHDSIEPDALKSQILDLAASAGDAGEKPAPASTMSSALELCRRYPTLRPPVIRGLLRQGETMNIISAPKIGKSWLAMSLAVTVASGGVWLGRFQVEPAAVLYIDNELHPETFAHRLPKVAAALGVEVPRNLFVDPLRGRLRDIYSMASYFDAIERGRFGLIIVDAFYRTLPKGSDENDNGEMTNIYNAIDCYGEKLGSSFSLIHHSSKGIQAGKAVTDVGAGAGAQSRATDTHLVLRQHEEDGAVVLDAAARSWAPLTPFCLRWDFPIWQPADDLDPAALRLEKKRPRKEERQTNEPATPEMTAERFVEQFITDQPQARDLIIARAVQAKLPQRRVEQLLLLALADGRMFEWSLKGDRKTHLANRRQELFG